MSPNQNSLYWREWAAVLRQCKASGLAIPDRHALHAAALGSDKSHLAFTNEDFDRVLAEFRSYSRPADLVAQLRQHNQPRIRFKYSINALAPAPEYWARIARNKFGTDDLDALSIEQLTQLRNTLAARGRARQRRQSAAGERDDALDNRSLRGERSEMAAADTSAVAA